MNMVLDPSTLFPAYELEINKQVIYTRDPIPNGNNPEDLGVSEGDQIQLNLSDSL